MGCATSRLTVNCFQMPQRFSTIYKIYIYIFTALKGCRGCSHSQSSVCSCQLHCDNERNENGLFYNSFALSSPLSLSLFPFLHLTVISAKVFTIIWQMVCHLKEQGERATSYAIRLTVLCKYFRMQIILLFFWLLNESIRI